MKTKQIGELEILLCSLLKSEYSSLILSFNEACAPNYQTVREIEDEAEKQDDIHQFDWVSEEERQKAIESNSMWGLQYYPNTPNGFYAIAASSIEALIDRIEKDQS